MCEVKRHSISSLARELNVSKQTLFNWLDGISQPRFADSWKRIAEILEVDLDWLMDPDTDYPPPGEPASLRKLPIGGNLVELLLDILEDPNSTQEQKRLARLTISEWFKNGRVN